MEITPEQCRELLDYLRFQLRGTGWVVVDQIIADDLDSERVGYSEPLWRLKAYLKEAQHQIVARSGPGLFGALDSLNQTLGKDGERIRGVRLDLGLGEDRSLDQLLPSEANVTAFVRILHGLETQIADGRLVDRDRPEEQGPMRSQ